MANLNEVKLIGRLTRDVEFSATSSGTSLAKFGLATSRKYKETEETTFVDITAWGKLADICSQYLSKGSNVYLGGRLKLDTWEDKDGNRRQKLSVVAENVQFLDSKKQDNREEPPF